MRKVRLVISGDVQGVGFRAWIAKHAHELLLKGWVKNRPDGAVEAVFVGEDEKITEMIELCEAGPEIAWVENVIVTEQEHMDEFVDFEVVK